MRRHIINLSVACFVSLLVCHPTVSGAAPGRLIIDAGQAGAHISPVLYGLMTEEINRGYDGGLYAELIQNRDFGANPNSPVHWSLMQDTGASAAMALDTDAPANTALAHSLQVSIATASKTQRVGIANDGYWGIPARPFARYRMSFHARSDSGFEGPLTLRIESSDGAKVLAQAQIKTIGSTWKRYTATLTTGDVAPSLSNRFVIYAQHPGKLWLTLVSLFPPTYHNRPNGNRSDLMQKLDAMQPAFLRLPGGNYLEGNTIATRFEWKNTIGDISLRAGHNGTWGYRSSDGLGLLEFLEWCEDLHMQPVLAVYAGYSLNGTHVNPGPDLAPFVQDALDEIEYVAGDAKSTWGARRVADGHPKPFPLTYVEIGNEDFFDKQGTYDARFAQYYDAIKTRYPNLQLISTAKISSRTPDIYDDHYYRSAAAMERDTRHYDGYSRMGPKIFVGEWATIEGEPTPTMNAALGDAAWLTGIERNSDLVVLSSYAPLLVNVNKGAWAWSTNLIGYDALSSFGSPSYYMQCMFNRNRGDVVLPVHIQPAETPQIGPFNPQGAIGVGTWETQAQFKDISITNGDKVLYQHDFTSGFSGWHTNGGRWQTQDGALRQSAPGTNCWATTGDPGWTDYTYSLKARKTGGSEGFIILFHVKDIANCVWWNIGGWQNSHTALEKSFEGAKTGIGPSSPVTVETGRWYDIRIEVKGASIRCYLDNRLVTEATDRPVPGVDPIYATASRDNASGDVILKVVNVSDCDQLLTVDLQGVKSVAPTARGEILCGNPGDMNSIDEPEKVAPKPIEIHDAAAIFVHNFPAHSISVIRVKIKGI